MISIKKLFSSVLLILFLLFFFGPIILMVIVSISPERELFSALLIPIPFEQTLVGYMNVLSRTYFLRWFINSLIVAIFALAISLPISSIIAYASVSFRKKYSIFRLFGDLSILLYMIPGVILALPLSILFSLIKLQDTLIGLAVADSSFALPLCFWLLWGYLINIPKELEESAMVDGASRFTILTRIYLPMMGEGLGAAAMFVFLTVWLDYLFALAILRSSENFVLSLGINWLIREYTFMWTELMAAAFMMALPSFIVSFIVFKYLMRGFELIMKG